MAEICQRVYDGFGMPVEWVLGIVVTIFKGLGDIRNCCCYGAGVPYLVCLPPLVCNR